MTERPKKRYTPPIAWDRFDAMLFALKETVYNKKPLDTALAAEISAAIYALRAIYQRELRQSLGGKKTKLADLRAAAIASILVERHGATPEEAMQAATGKASRVAAECVARTLKNRRQQADGDWFFDGPLDLEGALKRLKQLRKNER